MALPVNDTPDMLAVALEAHAAGLCVVRARTDGSKAPRGEWKEYQTRRPDEDELRSWFGNGHPGIGVVCGEISGNLEMLELEGVAMVGGVGDRVVAACRKAGIGHILDKVAGGYQERTPSDGVHWLYRVEGEPVPGNMKIARRAASEAELAVKPDDKVKTLIETRGEGGFTIIAPSHGPTHPTGLPWVMKRGGFATIPTITTAERQLLHDICAEFNTYEAEHRASEPVPVTSRVAQTAYDGSNVGASWYNAVNDHLAGTLTWDALLGRYGWTYLRQDRHGSDLWTRPGKDDGVSAWVKNDRLCVFSTSTPLDSTERTTLDRLDVIADYEHRSDRKEAARHIADVTGIMQRWRLEQDAENNTLNGPITLGTTAPASATTNTETGEIRSTLNLPDEFWDSRPSLRHIRQAAHARTRSADAVLLFVLARVAATIHPMITLPAIVGGLSSLNFLGGVIASSGGGKSSAGGVARELVPIRSDHIASDVPPGSGEGMTELYFGMVEEETAEGKKRKVKRQVKWGAFIYLDEGQALAEMGNRKGATLLPTLRSAWSGEVIGQSNATQETHRVLSAHSYRMSIMVGFQLEYAADLVADTAGGTPQRFVFASATDPSIPDERPEWPGIIETNPPDIAGRAHSFTFDDEITDEIRQRQLESARGTRIIDPLDGHADLVRMKVAALLAFMDGGLTVNAQDWDLAGMVMATSNAVRTRVIHTAQAQSSEREQAHRDLLAGRDEASERAAIRRAVTSGAKSIGRRVHKLGDAAQRDLMSAVASKHRTLVGGIDEMVDHAIGEGWIVQIADRYTPGKKHP